MGVRVYFRVMLVLFMAWLAWSKQPVMAAPAPTCHATSSLDTTYVDLAAQARRWTCSNSHWNYKAETTFIRFVPVADQIPRSFVSRIGRFDRIILSAIDRDGTTRSRSYAMSDTLPIAAGPYFALPLPEVTAQTRHVLVRIDKPWVNNILAEARLSQSVAGDGWAFGSLALLTAICGLLMAPLVLNLAFYLILRERFVLWHACLIFGMLGQAVVSSGLIHTLVTLPFVVTVAMMSISLTFGVSAAALFTADFIEPNKLSRRTRWLLRWSALPNLVIGVACSLKLAPLREFALPVYYLSLLPMMALFAWAMVEAWVRGSRMVLFQIIGWAPSLLVGLYRIFSNIRADTPPADAMVAYNVAIAFEVMVTALGVAWRFLGIKRERDRARIEAQLMSEMAEMDALTGLLNRRAVEPRYGALIAQGFTVMAILDLDHFKAINDTFGHAAGDEVLKATAIALAADADSMALRLGGEEFMLLLRGQDAVQRAEAKRRAITLRIAELVPGLDRPITASMGLIDCNGAEAEPSDFLTSYQQCDRLLYEAKHAGRNQMRFEKILNAGQDYPGLRMAAG
jgi:diguanylate cyclase (GGDEF)-like protein